jgi:uncharacterized protein YsxB (DUF464 family)
MISLILNETPDFYIIKATGHSGKQNESIVCASVSILFETWRLTEIALQSTPITVGDGILEASVMKTPISQILFTQLCIGSQALQKQYPSEISLNIGG